MHLILATREAIDKSLEPGIYDKALVTQLVFENRYLKVHLPALSWVSITCCYMTFTINECTIYEQMHKSVPVFEHQTNLLTSSTFTHCTSNSSFNAMDSGMCGSTVGL